MGFTPRPEDMVAAQRLHYVKRLWSWASLVSFVVSLLVVAVFVRIAMSDASWPWIAFVFGAATLGGILTPLAMLRWYVPRVGRRIFRQQRGLHRAFAVDWDETELRSSSEKGNSRVAWADYLRWRENREIIMLYHAENLFQFMPKRILTEAQVDDIRSIAAQANVKGAASKRRDDQSARIAG